MKNEVIEKAAKAYADAIGYYVEFHRGLSSEGFDKIRKGVRAVIASLREPSDAMLAAGVVHDDATYSTWCAMIDAALAENEK